MVGKVGSGASIPVDSVLGVAVVLSVIYLLPSVNTDKSNLPVDSRLSISPVLQTVDLGLGWRCER